MVPEVGIKVIDGPDLAAIDTARRYLMARNADGTRSEYFGLPMVVVTVESNILAPV